METALAVIQAVKEVSGLVTTIVEQRRSGNAISKGNIQYLQMQIDSVLRECRTRELQKQIKVNFEILREVSEYLKKLNPKDLEYDLCVEQLRILNEKLKDILKGI